MILYLNNDSFTITNDQGDSVSLFDAQSYYEKGLVKDSNQAFQRLANYGFDLDKLRDFYEKF